MNPSKPNIVLILSHLLKLSMLGLLLTFVHPGSGLSEIRFSEATDAANIRHSGTTYGASWGDFNGDGWPDLWVGNHNTKPTLYLNLKNGTFENIIDQVWSDDPKADTHGVAWADFDNDGDQDFVELVDVRENADGTFSVGLGKNHLFINENGKLVERAQAYGLADEGMARSPLWFDADRDGFLDLLVVNMPGKDHPASRLYLQRNGRFEEAETTFGFRDGPMDWSEKIRSRIPSLMKLSYPSPAVFKARRFLESAQLADLSADGASDLLLFTDPSRVYSVVKTPLQEVTFKIGLPVLDDVSDAAIADFDGDGTMDIYAPRGDYMPADVIQTTPHQLKGYVTCVQRKVPKAVHFKSAGAVRFQIFPTWLSLSKIYLGSTGKHPADRVFTLSPDDAAIHGPVDPATATFDGTSISYAPETQTWSIWNFHKSIFADLQADAAEPITDLKTVGFERFEEKGRDSLFLHRGRGFVEKPLMRDAGGDTSCYFVAAGDFDNDMDMDLYLTCTGPVENLPNRLLENDGQGNFTLVPGAGGASGSQFGRGDVVATADYDRDGFLDLFITNGHDPTSPLTENGPHQLFRNQGNDNHWLEIDLQGVKSNRDGIGAKVELEANRVVQIREQTGGMHRITQNHQRLHFGLGKNSRIERITVTWPSGIVQHLKEVQADQILHIKESSSVHS